MAKKSSGFKYRGDERTSESTKRRQQSAGRSYDSYISAELQTFKPSEGENNVRILPQSGEVDWDVPVYIHYSVGPDNSTYLCLDKNGKKGGCPVCAARRETDDDDERDKLRVSERRLAWIIDRDDEKAGPMIWSIPPTLYKDILGRSVDKKTGDVIKIDDPEEGYDVSFEREGSDQRTKYTGVEVSRDASPIHDKESTQDKCLQYIAENPIADSLVFYDAEYIEKVLGGESAEDEEEEDEKPKRRRGRASKGDEDEEEEDEKPTRSSRRSKEDEDDEDEDEEEKPKRRGRASKEDEDEDGDEDEDEKPPRRQRSKSKEDEDEEENERPTRSRRGKSKEDEDEDDEGDEDEEDKPARRKLNVRSAKSRRR